jgi:excisionase family DNA binding protein
MAAESAATAIPTLGQPPEISVPVITLALPAATLDDLSKCIAAVIIGEIRNETPTASPWLTVPEAATYLSLSRDSLYKLTAARAIPCRKKQGGQGLRFHRDELDAWMETQYPRLDRLA